ncbi:insulin-like 5a [Dicentrarchus labrax]|uniref:Insulin-like 5a n=2 Tax=Moronidae TaxID=42148 RepID=A0A8C4P0K7_DICLA|nr:insulin-like 5a [Dicentrarchus labrax]
MQALDKRPVHCAEASNRLDSRKKHSKTADSRGHFRTNQTVKEIHLHTDCQASSMRALVVLPLLLCAVVHVDQVRAEVKAVKLCGREFLRAVVYTCGGSRWRRFLSETDMDGDGLPAGEQSSLESLSSSNPGSRLTRRDMNNILTTVCCQVGCRKSDLTFLC